MSTGMVFVPTPKTKKIKGLTIQMKGRINGSLRKKKIVAIYGNIKQPHKYSNIDYSDTPIQTKFGTIGIKVLKSSR